MFVGHAHLLFNNELVNVLAKIKAVGSTFVEFGRNIVDMQSECVQVTLCVIVWLACSDLPCLFYEFIAMHCGVVKLKEPFNSDYLLFPFLEFFVYYKIFFLFKTNLLKFNVDVDGYFLIGLCVSGLERSFEIMSKEFSFSSLDLC